jgi:8-oxo-dGTP diphosphatase
MRHSVIPAINVAFVNGSDILLSRRKNTGWEDGKLCLPGGHVEPGETPVSAIVREISEELGVDIKSEDLEFLCFAARYAPSKEYYSVEFIVRDKAYVVRNSETEKCSELIWVNLDNLPIDVIDDFRQIIKRSIIGKETFLELGY